MLIRLITATAFFFCILRLPAQDSLAIQQIPSKYFGNVSATAHSLQKKLDKKAGKALQYMIKLEMKMQRKLAKVDSGKAKEVFGNTGEKYKELEQRLNGKLPGSYLSILDTLGSSLEFLQQNPQLIAWVKEGSQKLKDAVSKVKDLESEFQKAEEIKRYLRERKRFLKEQLSKWGFRKELKGISKQAYYYQQQVEEYKVLLKDREKAERKTLALLRNTKLFKGFMRKHSVLASLFRLPGSPLQTSPPLAEGLAGLQTRAQVNNLIQSQVGGSPSAMQQFRGDLADAQSQLNQLKNKIGQFGGGSNDIMPEGFKPNKARTLPFSKRLQLSTDFQTTRHNKLFPANSDVGFAISYMLNSNSHLSVGSSFKIGWGTGFNHIRLTAQGASVRAGLDWRLKNNLFIAGNYEQHYFSEIRDIDQLRNYSQWKSAALLGLSKKYKARKGRSGVITILYDFFYNRPPVRTQPVTIRFGFNLK